jgi:hypothetical protein
VVIFAVLVSITEYYGIFGIFIAAWILYQSFEAFHTAKALRDGQPLPDPLGLNEVGNWLNLGSNASAHIPASPRCRQPGPRRPTPAAIPVPAPGQPTSLPRRPGYQPPYSSHAYTEAPTSSRTRHRISRLPPFRTGPGRSGAQFRPSPVPPLYWRRKEPIGAIVLIALGLLFLLGQLDLFNGRLIEFTWPLA